MDTVEILKRARDHIAKPGQWYQGNFSIGFDEISAVRNAERGKPCCAAGSLIWATARDGGLVCENTQRAWDQLDKASSEHGFRIVAKFNDAPGRTQEEVVALFDRAIELAEAEQ